MIYLDRNATITKMDDLSSRKEPFLFVVNFDQTKSLVLKNNEIHPEEIQFEVDGLSNSLPTSMDGKGATLSKDVISYEAFLKSFKVVTKNINYGNSFLTNLTFKTPIESNLSLAEIYAISKAKYKLILEDQFVLFSPESFVKIEGDRIASFPMKGTIDASTPNAETVILNDPKEMAEHVTIVDLIRNDLSMVADNVAVERFRYIDQVKTNQKHLLQVSSEVSGKLKEEYKNKLGSLIFRLLPAGSITGAPKPQTVKVISEAEKFDRGFYTGVFGYYDGKKLNSAVMIRFIEQQNGKLFFKSGGGITHFSDPEKEYQEYQDKIYLPIHQATTVALKNE